MTFCPIGIAIGLEIAQQRSFGVNLNYIRKTALRSRFSIQIPRFVDIHCESVSLQVDFSVLQ
jgi:hypothetical protein